MRLFNMPRRHQLADVNSRAVRKLISRYIGDYLTCVPSVNHQECMVHLAVFARASRDNHSLPQKIMQSYGSQSAVKFRVRCLGFGSVQRHTGISHVQLV